MDAEIDLRAVTGFLQRQARLIALTVLVTMALVIGVLFTLTPIYSATTLVMVDPADKNLLAPQTQFGTNLAADARIEGEVLLAKSDNVLLAVIDRENLVTDEEFGPELGLTSRLLSFFRLYRPALPVGEQAQRQTLDKLAARTSVERERSTYLLSISVKSRDADRAAALANAVAHAYIDTQLRAKVQSSLDARNVLLEQVDAARQAVIDTDGSFDRYIGDNLQSLVQQTGSADVFRLEGEIKQLASMRETVTARLRNSEASSATLGQSSELQELRTQLAQIQQNETALRQDLRSAVLAGPLSPDRLTAIYELQQQSNLARQQYDQLLARAQHLQVEATLQLADSRVVSAALPPNSPSFPKTGTSLSLAALLSLVLGLLLAFLHEHFIGGITSDDQLASIARTRLAVSVPRVRLLPGQNGVSDLPVDQPLSAFAESIRRIRSTIDQQLAARGNLRDKAPVIQVSSTLAGEGKTVTALALARSYALAGRRTLIIDCDLRYPAVHEELGVKPSNGLIDALASDDPAAAFQSVTIRDNNSDLLVLIGSRPSSEGTDQLVTSRNFERLLKAATQVFDIVVLDTPPLGAVVDGLYIAQKADAVIYLVQWAATSQNDVRKALLSLEGALSDDDVLIPVLNMVEIAPAKYQRRYARLSGTTA